MVDSPAEDIMTSRVVSLATVQRAKMGREGSVRQLRTSYITSRTAEGALRASRGKPGCPLKPRAS